MAPYSPEGRELQRLSITVAGVHRIATHLGVPTELVQNIGIARSIGRIM